MKKIALLFVVLGVMFISYTNVSACVCMVEPHSSEKIFTKNVTNEFNNSAYVFSGKVIAAEHVSITKTDNKTGQEVKGLTLIYRFSVNSTWKGEPKSEIILNTNIYKFGDTMQSTSCDFDFKIGEQYLVFAFESEGKLKINKYGRTGLTKNSKYNIKVLQKINKRKLYKL